MDTERAAQRIDHAATVGCLERAITAATKFERLPPEPGAPPADPRQIQPARVVVGEPLDEAEGDRSASSVKVWPRLPRRYLSANELRPANADLGGEACVRLRRAREMIRALPRRRTLPTPLDLPPHRCSILRHRSDSQAIHLDPPAVGSRSTWVLPACWRRIQPAGPPSRGGRYTARRLRQPRVHRLRPIDAARHVPRAPVTGFAKIRIDPSIRHGGPAKP